MSLLNSFTGRSIGSEILRNGGGTYAVQVSNGGGVLLTDSKFTDGYMVSLYGAERIIPVSEFCDFVVGEFVGDYFDALTDPEYFLGAWVFEGNVYLDISTHTYSREYGNSFGKQNRQLAIFDCFEGEAIPVV